MKTIRKIILLTCWLIAVKSLLSNTPIWTTSQYFRAGSEDIINTRTGSDKTPTYPFTFSSSLPGIPNLGYGIKRYEGNDYLGIEAFEIRRVSLTDSAFTVSVQIVGTTNIFYMGISYIAIDPTFPHHLNSFDNVPVNYPSKPLTNISSASSATQYYYNTIDYSSQAAGSTYNTFLEPFSNIKILLLMTDLYIMGSYDCNQPFSYPINLQINAAVTSATTYLLTVSLSTQVSIYSLGFSEIIFDYYDVKSSLKYMIVYEKVYIDLTIANFIPIPQQFVDNFIMGFTDFSTPQTYTIIDFQLNWETQGGQFGVAVPISIGQGSLGCSDNTITRAGFTMFYMKSWLCPNQTNLFDPDTDLCIECPVPGCSICLNKTACYECDYLYYLEPTSLLCFECDLEYCAQCTTMEEANVCECKFTLEGGSIVTSGCNQITIILTPDPMLPQENLRDKIQVQHENLTNCELNKTSQTQISIVCILSGDLEDPDVQIQYTPGQPIKIRYESITPAIQYSKQECQNAQSSEELVKAFIIIGWIFMIISILNCKIVGLQLGGILQLSYFVLADYDFFHIYLAPLTQLKVMNGLNIPFFKKVDPSNLPLQMDEMDVYPSFFNNCNLMLLLLLLMGIIGLALYWLGLCFEKVAASKIHKTLLKQGFITLVMFNCLNFSFSAAVHWKYANATSNSLYIVSSICLYLALGLMIGSVIAIQILSSDGYGEFNNKFKDHPVNRFYIALSLCYKIAIGIMIAAKNTYEDAPLIMTMISISFFMYFIVNLPFQDTIQNYRAGLIHITQIAIIYTANYYRSIEGNTPLSIKAHRHRAAYIQLILIIACIVISFITLMWEVQRFIKTKLIELRNKPKGAEVVEQSNQTIQQEDTIPASSNMNNNQDYMMPE